MDTKKTAYFSSTETLSEFNCTKAKEEDDDDNYEIMKEGLDVPKSEGLGKKVSDFNSRLVE